MSHYLAKISLATLEANCREHFDGVAWVKQWNVVSAMQSQGWYTAGQANIAGPIQVPGPPDTEWYEIVGENQDVIDQIALLADDMGLMRDVVRSNGPMRGIYSASQRGLIRKPSNGAPVGPMPFYAIAGRDPDASFLAGEDIEEATELPDLEQ